MLMPLGMIVLALWIVGGIGAWMYLGGEAAPPRSDTVSKSRYEYTIRKLDGGYVVECAQHNNPYPYRSASAPDLEGAIKIVWECRRGK